MFAWAVLVMSSTYDETGFFGSRNHHQWYHCRYLSGLEVVEPSVLLIKHSIFPKAKLSQLLTPCCKTFFTASSSSYYKTFDFSGKHFTHRRQRVPQIRVKVSLLHDGIMGVRKPDDGDALRHRDILHVEAPKGYDLD